MLGIVLVQPEIPGNTGAVWRTCVALDAELILIHPLGFQISDARVKRSMANVPTEVLHPRQTWKDGTAYDAQAKKLAEMFRKNFEKFGDVDFSIRAAGPR